ncbi:MAG: DUF2232 domain-containing protein [bacterium]
MKASSPAALASVGKATAVTIALGLLMAVFPLAAVVVIPTLALPTAHVVASRGVPSGLVVALAAAAVLFAGFGMGLAMLVLLLCLAVGMVLGLAVRGRWKFGRSLAAVAAAVFGALLVWGTALWLILGLDLTRLRESVDGSIAEAAALYARMGVGTETVDAASAQLRQIARVVPYLTPGLMGIAAVLLAVCSLGLAYLLFPRLREKVAVGLSLSGFRMHWAAAYASIAGLAMLVFARGDAEWRTVVLYVGINVLLVSQTLFFLQGLAVARWFVVTRQLRPGSRAALYIGAILGQALFQVTGLIGLLDTWLDYRKRFALKSPGTGPVR